MLLLLLKIKLLLKLWLKPRASAALAILTLHAAHKTNVTELTTIMNAITSEIMTAFVTISTFSVERLFL